MMEYFENSTDWANTRSTLRNENSKVVTTENDLNQNADDNERYVADMINIICRPVLFIFGTMGRFLLKYLIY